MTQWFDRMSEEEFFAPPSLPERLAWAVMCAVRRFNQSHQSHQSIYLRRRDENDPAQVYVFSNLLCLGVRFVSHAVHNPWQPSSQTIVFKPAKHPLDFG
jgi:hypothetical protein